MQPYLFPYLGYFQLVHAVDKFVFYDDANYIKNGWINRNRILVNGKPHYFTVPLSGASPFRPIRETQVEDPSRWKSKMFALFEQSYARAPHVATGMSALSAIFASPTDRIADLARESVVTIMKLIGLTTAIVHSSAGYANQDLKGQERVIDICRKENADTYVNAPGGRELYSAERFRERGIALAFIEPQLEPYPQLRTPQFVPGLSVLDVLMNCGVERLRGMVRVPVSSA